MRGPTSIRRTSTLALFFLAVALLVFWPGGQAEAEWKRKPFRPKPYRIQPDRRPKLERPFIVEPKFIDHTVTIRRPFYARSISLPPRPADSPVLHRLADYYQFNKRFEDLFSKSGNSMLCGPASLGNVLNYLRHWHRPPYPNIGKNVRYRTHGDWMRAVYRCSKTDKEKGTYVTDLRDCARRLVRQGGYNTRRIRIIGAGAPRAALKRAVQPADIRRQLTPGPDNGVVILFGWYRRVKEKDGTWIFKRAGGHFVALAGFDRNDQRVFYVSNPLVNYYQLHPDNPELRYSRLRLQPLPAGVQAPANVGWGTRDLIGGNFAILENMLVIDPRR